MRAAASGYLAGNASVLFSAPGGPPVASTEIYSFREDLDLHACFQGDAWLRDACCKGRVKGFGRACSSPPWFHWERCCRSRFTLPILEDSVCFDQIGRHRKPQRKPSATEPLVFLWDAKSGGNTMRQTLFEGLAEVGLLKQSHISGSIHPNLAGTPFLVKNYPPKALERLVTVAGHFDWRVMSALRCGRKRRPRCVVLLRHPVERFVSWALDVFRHNHESRHSKDTNFAKQKDWEAALMDWHHGGVHDLLHHLALSRMNFTGWEEGVFCSSGMCLNATESWAAGLPQGLLESSLPDFFRTLGGPQNRLLRLLDPAGRLHVAKQRLELCTVGMMVERTQETLGALAYAFPWLKEVRVQGRELHHPGARNKNPAFEEQKRRIYKQASKEPLASSLRAFNALDLELYEYGVRLFEQQQRAIPKVKMIEDANLGVRQWALYVAEERRANASLTQEPFILS